MTMPRKPTVGYRNAGMDIKVGYSALVYTYDHPSPQVTNGHLVRTSRVIKILDEGMFETENTIYIVEGLE